MTKLISLAEDVYEELNRIREREGKSFSEVIRELLRYRYLDIRGLLELEVAGYREGGFGWRSSVV